MGPLELPVDFDIKKFRDAMLKPKGHPMTETEKTKFSEWWVSQFGDAPKGLVAQMAWQAALAQAVPQGYVVIEPEQRAVEQCGGKGLNKTFRPKSGRVLLSAPHMDNENGYTFAEFNILWANDLFLLYGNDGYWPCLARWEHVIAKPLPAAPKVGE